MGGHWSSFSQMELASSSGVPSLNRDRPLRPRRNSLQFLAVSRESHPMRMLLTITVAVVVLLGSFWATLRLLDYWNSPEDPNANLIQITEATYGMSCREVVGSSARASEVKVGNATEAIKAACPHEKGRCSFVAGA